MKIIDVLELMNDYDRIRIHPTCDMEWDEENPYTLDGLRVRELGWLFVQKLASKTIVEIASDKVETNGEILTCVTLVYR